MPVTSRSSTSGPNITRWGLPMSTVRTLRSTNFCGWLSPRSAGPMPTVAQAVSGSAAWA